MARVSAPTKHLRIESKNFYKELCWIRTKAQDWACLAETTLDQCLLPKCTRGT